MNVGFLYSQIRADEKLLLTELRSRGHDILKIDVRKHQFSIQGPPSEFKDLDVVIDRCIAQSQSKFASLFFASYGIPIINDPMVVERCSDKVKTSSSDFETESYEDPVYDPLEPINRAIFSFNNVADKVIFMDKGSIIEDCSKKEFML